ncbi:MAG: NAD(P)-dependent oxidoreductase [Gammaproteobacteria bacterium]|nr:MAG: NAD(P)-dependent oxidoreductase [Gammaproteobacteria bacterium]
MTMKKIGFVGLGNMGLPMVKNLLAADFQMRVFSRSRGPIEAAIAAGAVEAESLPALAEWAEVVCTCLPMPEDVEAVYLNAGGLLSGTVAGTVFIDHSTVGPDTNRKIAARADEANAEFLDAPVSGGPGGAAAATLAIMVGGKLEVFTAVADVLAAMGKTVVRLGNCGAGSVAKLLNNQLVGIHQRAVIEALMVAQANDLNLDQLYQVLKGSSGNSVILELMYPLIKARDLTPRFRNTLFHKDMRLALEMARECGIDTAMGRTAFVAVDAAQQAGMGDQDSLAMLLPLEEQNGIKLFASGDE